MIGSIKYIYAIGWMRKRDRILNGDEFIKMIPGGVRGVVVIYIEMKHG